MCRIKIRVWVTDGSGAMNLKYYKKWFHAIEAEIKITIASSSDMAVVLTPVMLNFAKKVTRTR